jgi:hypothetical protein
MRMVEAMSSDADDAVNNALEVESLPAGLALEEAESLLPVTRLDRQLERLHCFPPNPTPSSSPGPESSLPSPYTTPLVQRPWWNQSTAPPPYNPWLDRRAHGSTTPMPVVTNPN